jgi:hypothetical protein
MDLTFDHPSSSCVQHVIRLVDPWSCTALFHLLLWPSGLLFCVLWTRFQTLPGPLSILLGARRKHKCPRSGSGKRKAKRSAQRREELMFGREPTSCSHAAFAAKFEKDIDTLLHDLTTSPIYRQRVVGVMLNEETRSTRRTENSTSGSFPCRRMMD